jgi:hypothetical protein
VLPLTAAAPDPATLSPPTFGLRLTIPVPASAPMSRRNNETTGRLVGAIQSTRWTFVATRAAVTSV